MKKSEILSMKSIAYYSGCGGLEIKHIEYDIDDYLYCVSGAWVGKLVPHKLKIYSDREGEFVKLHGCKISLNDCIRM